MQDETVLETAEMAETTPAPQAEQPAADPNPAQPLPAAQAQPAAELPAPAPEPDDLAPWLAFVQEFPQVAASGQLDAQVVARIEQGESPVAAQRAFEMGLLQSRVRALEAALHNQSAAAASLAEGDAPPAPDPFLLGLETDY